MLFQISINLNCGKFNFPFLHAHNRQIYTSADFYQELQTYIAKGLLDISIFLLGWPKDPSNLTCPILNSLNSLNSFSVYLPFPQANYCFLYLKMVTSFTQPPMLETEESLYFLTLPYSPHSITKCY